MERGIIRRPLARRIIGLVAVAAYGLLLVSVATDAFVGRWETVFASVGTVSVFLLVFTRGSRSPRTRR